MAAVCRALVLVGLALLAACPGGSGSLGDSCSDNGDCTSSLQCVASACVPRCQRAPECGDGYACDPAGLCKLATGQAGDRCASEVECAPGLACQIDPGTDELGQLRSSCTTQNASRPAGAACGDDRDCRNGTCALGRCVDLCTQTRDCSAGLSCTGIPRVLANGAMFQGCLPSRGSVTWTIPVAGASAALLLPVPESARSATVVFSVDDVAQKVGALGVRSPSDQLLYTKPCEPAIVPSPACDAQIALDQYYAQPVRHLPELGQSVLQIPSSPGMALEPGAYQLKVGSLRPNGASGSALPHVTATVKMDPAVFLDLHFYFLDLDDHPCEPAFGNGRLDATSAQAASFFQTDYLGELRTVFAAGGVALGSTTFENVTNHPDLDGLAVEDAGSLLALGAHDVGINVFFVRSLSPVGLQAFGPNPGPAGLAGTRQSGVVIGVETLCYRSWKQLARMTAHEIARYMGLYHNVELEVAHHPTWRDPISDSDDSSNNLMFFSELGGIEISAGQREILVKSAVLR